MNDEQLMTMVGKMLEDYTFIQIREALDAEEEEWMFGGH